MRTEAARELRSLAVAGLVILAGCTGALPDTAAFPGSSTTVSSGSVPSTSTSVAARFPIQVQLAAVEFRDEAHPEDAAIRYSIRITNVSDQEVVVQMDKHDIEARDEEGNEFEDYWSQAERNHEAGCTCTGCDIPDFARATVLNLRLGPREARDVTLFLNPVDAEGVCERSGRARARVDPDTLSVEVSLPEIHYREDGSDPVEGVTLQLER